MALPVVLAYMILSICSLAAAFQIGPSFRSLIRLRPITLMSGAGFFLFGAVVGLGFSLGNETGPIYQTAIYFQAISMVTFLICLHTDLHRALRRLRAAFQAIRIAYGKDGERAIATVIAALQGK